MGIVDIEILMDINEQIKKLHTKYSFKVDLGSFETAIEFTPIGYNHPPKAKSWVDLNGNEIKCPDLLAYDDKIIIEWEEEHGNKKSGAKFAIKGHSHKGDVDTTRDTERNRLYRLAGFRVLRLYDSDPDWKKELKLFLIKCYNEDCRS